MTTLPGAVCTLALFALFLANPILATNDPTHLSNTAGDSLFLADYEAVDAARILELCSDTKYNWVLIWTHACGYCHLALPHYLEFERKHQDSLNLIVISLDSKPERTIPKLRGLGYSGTIYEVDGTLYPKKRLRYEAFLKDLDPACWSAEELQVYPTHISFDQEGKFTGKMAFNRSEEISRVLHPSFLQDFVTNLPKTILERK